MRLSVNIESPADVSASASSYYPTPQSIEFVRGLASAALDGGSAHALLGPYGVGKSSLAAFALNELSYTEPNARPHLFGTGESPVAEVLSAGGLAPMPVVGAPEPLASRVTLALKTLAGNESVLKDVPALAPYATLDPRDVSGDQALHMLVDAARTIRKRGKAGALLIIDEFGRHLEHMFSTASDGDLHLLQDIAEATGRAESPLSLVIIQHLGLEHYGSTLRGSTRYEWDKVRGRFVETVLHHTETDAAHIVAQALDAIGMARSEQQPQVRLPKAVPPILRDREFLTVAGRCCPLHPMTVVLLSRLARVLGQNDRTMVGWLTSDLESGFQAMRVKSHSRWLLPEALYDHFFRDALWAPPNPAFSGKFAAIHAAHERLDDDLSPQARRLFRTLALLSFCTGGSVRADRPSALACLPRGFPFDRAVDELIGRSLVLYRRYRSEYVIWEGSDYDLNSHVDEALPQTNLDVAAEMNRRFHAAVLAHGHLIRTGNRRTAPALWLNAGDPPPPGNGEPRILIWLVDGAPPDVELANDVVGAAAPHSMTPHLLESTVIRHLLDEDAELQEDAVAVKEVKSRLAFHEGRITEVRQELLESDLYWRVGQRRFDTLQEALSNAMDATYARAFKLHNDLVNRNQVSAPVAFALRKLIDQLYTSSEQENLGIEKFPAERIIYESLLKRTGLHTLAADGTWRLRLDGDLLTPGLAECISEVRRLFVDGRPPAALSVEDVAAHLSAPPYGLKRMPATLLCILVLLYDRNAHELHEEGRFLPHWGPDTLIRLLRAPKRFAIVSAAASPVSGRILRQYRGALVADDPTPVEVTPLALAREVLIRHARLSGYAQRTRTVSDPAQAFRRALEIATSPADMLFRRVPEAFGHRSLPTDTGARTAYFRGLKAVWAELEAADRALMARLEAAALDTLGCGSVRDARRLCRSFAEQLSAAEHLHHGYGAFLARIYDGEVVDDGDWLAGVIGKGLGISAPVRSWSDEHASHGEFLLRRNLAALRKTRDLLAEGAVQCDAAPFAVFWPNPGVASEDLVRQTAHEMASLAADLAPAERAVAIISAAKSLQEAE